MVQKITNKIIYFGFAALFFFTPLILTPINSELFEFNKMMFVYGVTVIVLAAWLIKALYSGEHIQGSRLEARGRDDLKQGDSLRETPCFFRRTPLDIPIFFFLVSQIVATFYSIDPHVSIWGYYSRQNGGLLSTISYIVLYYAFVSNLSLNPKSKTLNSKQIPNSKYQNSKKKQKPKRFRNLDFENSNLFRISDLEFRISRLLYFALASGVIVAGYGILQHFGIDKDIWVQDVVNRVFSSLGQPNWLAAYMAVLSFVALGIGIRGGNRENQGDRGKRGVRVFRDYFWVGVVGVFYLTILYTKSRSGFVGLWIANYLFWNILLQREINKNKQLLLAFFFIVNSLSMALFLFKANYLVFWFVNIIGYFVFLAVLNRSLFKLFLATNLSFIVLTFLVASPFQQINRLFSISAIQEKLAGRKIEKIIIDKGDRGDQGNQGTVISRGGTESGEIRKYVWQAALRAARENPLFGTGVETFAWAFYRYKPVEHNLTSEWDFLYNKAHNEYLNYLATTGFVGLGTYLLVIGVFVVWFIRDAKWEVGSEVSEVKGGKWENHTSHFSFLNYGLFAAWVSILVSNFFGFSVVVTSLYFWLIPAILFAYGEPSTVDRRLSTAEDERQIKRKGRTVVVGAIVLVAAYLLFILGKYWYADVLYARGKRYLRGGYSLQADQALRQAVDLRPEEPIFWDELGFLKGTLAIEAYGRKEATHAAGLVVDALDYQEKALRISPQNLNFLKTRVKLHYALSQIFDQEDLGDGEGEGVFSDSAIKTLELGRALAPNDPKILYNLALLQASQEGQRDKATKEIEGIEERSGVKRAIGTLMEALELKPDYRAARIALGLFYQEEGELEKARDQFEYILQNINPEDEEARKYLEEL